MRDDPKTFFTSGDIIEGLTIRPLLEECLPDEAGKVDVTALDASENAEAHVHGVATAWLAMIRRQQFFVRLAALFDKYPELENITLAPWGKRPIGTSIGLKSATSFTLSVPEGGDRDAGKRILRDLSRIRTLTGGTSSEVFDAVVRNLPRDGSFCMTRANRAEAVRTAIGAAQCAMVESARVAVRFDEARPGRRLRA